MFKIMFANSHHFLHFAIGLDVMQKPGHAQMPTEIEYYHIGNKGLTTYRTHP